jgi:phosphatidylglycerophosphate synthase
MFDRHILAVSKPLVEGIAKSLHRHGNTANQISITGFVLGMLAAVLISHGNISLAIFPLLMNRLLDGLDGSVARIAGATDRGAFLDITLDFLFYAAVPLAFAFCNPERNALAAAVLPSSVRASAFSPMPSWPKSVAKNPPPTRQNPSTIWAA